MPLLPRPTKFCSQISAPGNAKPGIGFEGGGCEYASLDRFRLRSVFWALASVCGTPWAESTRRETPTLTMVLGNWEMVAQVSSFVSSFLVWVWWRSSICYGATILVNVVALSFWLGFGKGFDLLVVCWGFGRASHVSAVVMVDLDLWWCYNFGELGSCFF